MGLRRAFQAFHAWGSILPAASPAGVAQLVEHHVANVVVVGSNPITRFLFPPFSARIS